MTNYISRFICFILGLYALKIVVWGWEDSFDFFNVLNLIHKDFKWFLGEKGKIDSGYSRL